MGMTGVEAVGSGDSVLDRPGGAGFGCRGIHGAGWGFGEWGCVDVELGVERVRIRMGSALRTTGTRSVRTQARPGFERRI